MTTRADREAVNIHLEAVGVKEGGMPRDKDGRLITDCSGFVADDTSVQRGYYYSPSFIATVFAIGLGFFAGVSAFAYAAPVLTTIDQDIGPDPNITWVALIHPVSLSVGLTIVGRLSDIFGRRWFFICGAVTAALGTLVSALAKNIPMLIAGATIKGVAAATQLSVYYAISELVPMNYRYMTNGAVYIFQLPASATAPLIAQSFVTQSSIGWRGFFYILTGANATSGLLYFFFYFPPDFQDKHGRAERKQEWVKHFDYLGVLLYSAGLVLFLLGLSWGGGVFPWKSAAVICAIVIGVFCLTSFFLWESYAPLREPLVPMQLFKNRGWISSAILAGIGAGVYYANAIVWPLLCQRLWAKGDVMYGAALSCVPGCSMCLGQIWGGAIARPLGKQKLQCIATAAVGGALIAAACIASPDIKAPACVLVSLGSFSLGWMETIAMTNTLITITDQQEIGAAAGIAGAVRTCIASIASTIFTLTLNARLIDTIPARVPKALLEAGLPKSSIPAFLAALKKGKFQGVPGLTPVIQARGLEANNWAYADAFRTVWLVSLAFTGCAVIVAVLSPNADKYMNNKIGATLSSRKNTKVQEV